jgi:hypothetical protein
MGVIETRRQWRREHKEELRHRGIRVARVRRILAVRITAIPMPDWARARRIKGLSFSESFVWLTPRDARFLMRLDREAGGEPYAAETEYRRCPTCHRPLIDDAARMRRELDESAVTGRMLPCGPECLDAEKDRRWRIAN